VKKRALKRIAATAFGGEFGMMASNSLLSKDLGLTTRK
jgi:hypothetical protein